MHPAWNFRWINVRTIEPLIRCSNPTIGRGRKTLSVNIVRVAGWVHWIFKKPMFIFKILWTPNICCVILLKRSAMWTILFRNAIIRLYFALLILKVCYFILKGVSVRKWWHLLGFWTALVARRAKRVRPVCITMEKKFRESGWRQTLQRNISSPMWNFGVVFPSCSHAIYNA